MSEDTTTNNTHLAVLLFSLLLHCLQVSVGVLLYIICDLWRRIGCALGMASTSRRDGF